MFGERALLTKELKTPRRQHPNSHIKESRPSRVEEPRIATITVTSETAKATAIKV